jgi:hypothetical protein
MYCARSTYTNGVVNTYLKDREAKVNLKLIVREGNFRISGVWDLCGLHGGFGLQLHGGADCSTQASLWLT